MISQISLENIKQFLIIHDKDLSNEEKQQINSIFEKADVGDNETAVKGDNQLSGNEIKSFLSNLKGQAANLIKKHFFSSNARANLWMLGGLSFDGKNTTEEQVNNDLKNFDKYIEKYEYTMDDSRKELFVKLRELIANKGVTFNDGLQEHNPNMSSNELESLFNLNISDLALLVERNVEKIIRNNCKDLEKRSPESITLSCREAGVTLEDAQNFVSKNNSYILLASNFITDEQYESISNYIDLITPDNSDFGAIQKKLEEVLTPEQKQTLQDKYVNCSDLAKNIIKRGFYTKYVIRFMEQESKRSMFSKETMEKKFIEGDKNIEAVSGKKVKYTPEDSVKYVAKSMLENSQVTDINTDHNQILDVIDAYKKQGGKMPSTIVNFDSHSDLYARNDSIKSIANWVNYAAAEEGVERIVWVVPQASIENNPDAEQLYFGDNGGRLVVTGNMDISQVGSPDKPLVQKFYLDLETKDLIPVTGGRVPEGKYKVIELVTCTEKTMPDFQNEDALLSIDGDYFNNCGFDTAYKVSNTPFDMKKAFENFLSSLDKAHLKPSITSMTMSPQYTSIARTGEVYGFYDYLMKNSPQKKDNIQKYTLDKQNTIQDGTVRKSKY